MSRNVKYDPKLRKHIKKYQIEDKLFSIFRLLGEDAQSVVDWATEEARRRRSEDSEGPDIGTLIFILIAQEAAIRLVKSNYERGRLTTKSEIRKKTGLKVEMPVLYRDAGLRHPQEARNLRHNIFHQAFLDYITHILPSVHTSVPSTGEGLTPDLIVHNNEPEWTISVEYKGYRSLTLLSESEILKGMRYQTEYGTAWLVTTTTKSVRDLYGSPIKVSDLIENGLKRLRRVAKRDAFTEEHRENAGIARKGIKHLEKHQHTNLRCVLLSVEELIESCKAGKPRKGLVITTGFEFVELLRSAGFEAHADEVLRIMKVPTFSLHSDNVTSMRLIG